MVPEDAGGPGVPEAGAQAALGYGWRTLREHLVPLLVVTAAYVVVEAVVGGVGPVLEGAGVGTAPMVIVEVLVGLVVSVPLGAALWFAYLETTRGEDPEVGDLLDGYDYFVDLVLASVIVAVAVGIGLLLLVLPGIYIGLRLAFVPLLVMDKDMGAWEAVQESGDRTAGETLSLLGLLVASVVILLVGFALLLVGVIPALAWVGTAWAGYYRAIDEAPAGGGAGSTAETAAGA